MPSASVDPAQPFDDASPPDDLEERLEPARRRVTLAARLLLLHGVLGILAAILGIVATNKWLGMEHASPASRVASPPPRFVAILAFQGPALFVSVFVVVAARLLLRGKGYALAVVASVFVAVLYPLALLASVFAASGAYFIGPFLVPTCGCCWPFSFGVGLFAFVVLQLPSTHEALRAPEEPPPEAGAS